MVEVATGEREREAAGSEAAATVAGSAAEVRAVVETAYGAVLQKAYGVRR